MKLTHAYDQDKKAEIFYVDGKEAAVLPLPYGCKDSFEKIEENVIKWTRRTQSPVDSMVMELRACYRHDFIMVPAVNYNGNNWGSSYEYTGFFDEGTPWTYGYHRVSLPACTYSEGKVNNELYISWGMYGLEEEGYCCSIFPEGDYTVHQIIWPEKETPRRLSYRHFEPAYYGTMEPKDSFSVCIVFSQVKEPKMGYKALLDVAWRMNYHKQHPSFPPEKLWELGITYANSLWASMDDGFQSFYKGYKWIDGEWRIRPTGLFEIGWCGQSASLANSFLYDYIKHKREDSLKKGLACLDSWFKYATLPIGIIHPRYDEMDRDFDACNLGTAARQYFEAIELLKSCNVERPEYFQAAINICDFALKHQKPDGLIGKSWNAKGELTVAEGTTGCFLVFPLVQAWEYTGENKYLEAAIKSYHYYYQELEKKGYTTAGALDTYCIDKESSIPLLQSGIKLYKATGEKEYLKCAENAAWYLSTWQYHYSVKYHEGCTLYDLKYDTFGGTAVSTAHNHIDSYALAYMIDLLELAKLTGNNQWRERAMAIWYNGTQGVSDGTLVVMGKVRPAGSQDEGFFHTRWADDFNVSQWLVAWPGAFRLEVMRKIGDLDLLK